MKLRKASPIDFSAMEALYSQHLADYVVQADQLLGPELAGEIQRALTEGKAGQNIYGNAQTIEKLIHYAHYLHFTEALRTLQTKTGDEASWAKLEKARPVIQATVLRRSQWVGLNEEYKTRFVELLGEIKAGKAESFDALRSLLTKVYLLSVLYELDGLSQARGQDADKTAEKMAEALAYYRFVQKETTQRDEAGQQTVSQQFALPAEEMDLDAVKQILARVFAVELADIPPDRIGLASK
ncbi:MAG TPA: hypothetical protein PKW95_03890 [bacterium]|nr:hypothetical protein [bacterium]